MSATDELRRLLDERRVEHHDGWSGEIRYTKWQGIGGMWFLTHDSFGTDGKLLYVQGIDMTPAQAIEATLGRGETERENAELRELVRDMWPHVRHRSRMCAECELPCDTSDECLLYEPMRQRMRELGVEVDA